MKMTISMVLGLGLLTAGIAGAGCKGKSSGSGGGDETGSGGGEGGGSSGSACSSADFEQQVIAICKAQNPPAPAPGEMGASCADGNQCDSMYCLEPFGSAAYCSLLCPTGKECPLGYTCTDTGNPGEAACYQDVCVYGGSDSADCTKNLLAELDTACSSDACTASKIHGWMDCLEGAGRVCGPEHAAEYCGPERGLVESCCSGCDDADW